MKAGVARRVRRLDIIGERCFLFRGTLKQEQHPPGRQGIFDRAQVRTGLKHTGVAISLNQRVRVAVQNHASVGLNGTLNAGRGLGDRGRSCWIARSGKRSYDSYVQCSQKDDPNEETQHSHAYLIGSLRYGL
jgi:hypothetical protein